MRSRAAIERLYQARYLKIAEPTVLRLTTDMVLTHVYGRDSAATETGYVDVYQPIDPTNGSGDAEFKVGTMVGGAFADRIKVSKGVVGAGDSYPGRGNLAI